MSPKLIYECTYYKHYLYIFACILLVFLLEFLYFSIIWGILCINGHEDRFRGKKKENMSVSKLNKEEKSSLE